MQDAFGGLDEPQDNVQPQAGALARTLGREVRLENPGKDLRRNAGSVVADGNRQKRGRIVELLGIEQAVLRPVPEGRQVQRLGQERGLGSRPDGAAGRTGTR